MSDAVSLIASLEACEAECRRIEQENTRLKARVWHKRRPNEERQSVSEDAGFPCEQVAPNWIAPPTSGPGPDASSPGISPVHKVMRYLGEHCSVHDKLGTPVLNPIQFVDWCNTTDVACVLMVGSRTVLPHHDEEDLPHLLKGKCMDEDGPFEGGKMQVFSEKHLRTANMSAATALKVRATVVRTNPAMVNLHKEYSSHGNQGGCYLCLMYSSSGGPAVFFIGCFLLVVVQMPEGEPHVGELSTDGRERTQQVLSTGEQRLCMLLAIEPLCSQTRDPRVSAGALRDFMALKYVPTMVTTCCEQGYVLSQNNSSISYIGPQGPAQCLTLASPESLPEYSQPHKLNYLIELLGSQAAVNRAIETINNKSFYRRRMRLKSPTLLRLMRMPTDAEVYHDVSISRLKDGVTGQMTYVVAEVDVTEACRASRRIQNLQSQQRELLNDILPPQVLDALLDENRPAPDLGQETLDNQHKSKSFNDHYKRFSLPGGHAREHAPGLRTSTVYHGKVKQGQHADDELKSTGLESMRLSMLSGGFPLHGAFSSIYPDTVEDPEDRLTSTWNMTPQHLTSADISRLSSYHEEVTVLFCLVEGFNSVSQTLHPSQVMLFLNQLFSAFDALLEEHDVYKIETIGDTYMVCSGLFDRTVNLNRRLSLIHASDADRTEPLILQPGSYHSSKLLLCKDSVTQEGNAGSAEPLTPLRRHKNMLGGSDPRHASKMMGFAKALLQRASSVTSPLGQPVKMRVGVHSGPIMTGVIGRKMPRFCCFGNTASRMESTGIPGAIHASAAFQSMTLEEPWIPTGGVEVKGKGHMDTYLMHPKPEWNSGQRCKPKVQ